MIGRPWLADDGQLTGVKPTFECPPESAVEWPKMARPLPEAVGRRRPTAAGRVVRGSTAGN
jgi:hypothetical protein